MKNLILCFIYYIFIRDWLECITEHEVLKKPANLVWLLINLLAPYVKISYLYTVTIS